MERLIQFIRKLPKVNRLSGLLKFMKSNSLNLNKAKKLDFGLIRISPSDKVFQFKEQFIPLARSTVIRKLSQNPTFISASNLTLFEEFNKYLEACIYNRNHFFLKEVKASYEHLNPDVEVLSGGIKSEISRRQILDEEFWFIQKLSRMFELGNFCEINRQEMEKLFYNEGGFNTLQTWVSSDKYEVLKLWVLGRENRESSGKIRAFFDKYLLGLLSKFNPFRVGDRYKRVVVATRLNKSNKIDLKMFKDLSEGELIHTIPEVAMTHSGMDNSILMWMAALFVAGWSTHLILPIPAFDSGWLSSTHQLATSLALLSAGVGVLHWNVIQNKKTSYWKWRSQMNYRSIIANNQGVISVLADRVQDEIFKESLLAYIHVLAHPHGISQTELESQVRVWAIENCDREFKDTSSNMKIELTEAISLLRQLNILILDQSSQILTAKPFESSAATLSAEFNASNLSVDLDGNTIIRNDDLNKFPDQPITEGYEKIRRTANEDK